MLQRKQEDLPVLSAAVLSAAVLRRIAQKERVPAAHLHVLLAVYTLSQIQPFFTSAELGQLQLMSLPLLRGYVRALEAKGWIRREKFFRRGPRTLALTSSGKPLAQQCARAVQRATDSFATK